MLKRRESIYTHYVPGTAPQHPDGTPAYWFLFSAGKLLVEKRFGRAAVPLTGTLTEQMIQAETAHYLGTWRSIPCYAAEPVEAAAVLRSFVFQDLRSLYGELEEGLFHLAGRAAQIVAWAKTHQYCGQCGSRTVPAKDEHAMLCPACGMPSYPRLAPAVITAILKGDQLLLAHARNFQNNMYGLIAGFVEPGETLEDCVEREIREEIGIKVRNIRYFGSQQWPFPHSLMIGFLADYDSGEIAVDGDEILAAGWFDGDHLPVIPNPVSIARKMIDWYTEEYRSGKLAAGAAEMGANKY